VSIKFTPNSTACRSTASAAARSFGGPQIPSPVIRIAPYPNRFTVNCPPREIVPAAFADSVCVGLQKRNQPILEEERDSQIFHMPSSANARFSPRGRPGAAVVGHGLAVEQPE